MHEIRMNHPAKNALGIELVRWLDAQLDAAGDEPILLTGTEGAFSAGLNLKFVGGADASGIEELLDALDRVCLRLFEHPAPTAAWINGHAIAGGCVLAQCCDFRVCTDSERARLGLNEVALGACFPPRILRLLLHRLPARSRHHVLLGAGLFEPREALALGLVDVVSADAEADARALLERAASHPRAAYAHAKRLLQADATAVTDAELERLRTVELSMWTSDELRERVRAVLAR